MATITKKAGRVLPIFKGDYSPTVQCNPMDVFNYYDESWVCKKDCMGIEPNIENSEYWQPFGTGIHSKKNAELAKSYADEAKKYRDEAQSVSNIDVATNEKLGNSKPDGESISIDVDGSLSVKAISEEFIRSLFA